jgi:hypothetical protein
MNSGDAKVRASDARSPQPKTFSYNSSGWGEARYISPQHENTSLPGSQADASELPAGR